jgi:putative transposase
MRGTYSVSELCRVLEVSRSGYQAWRHRAEGVRAQENLRLDQAIAEVFVARRRAYGSPRVVRELRQQGWGCGENRVARRMRQLGLAARVRRRFVPRTTQSDPTRAVAPNRLRELPPPTRLNQVWVTDITYLPTRDGFVYLAGIMDRCSRRIVGWAVGPTLERELVLRALRQAWQQRQPPAGCLHHSDRGSQYTSEDYRQLLAVYGLEASRSRAGNCYDNAAMESFWSTLKAEGLQELPADEAAARLVVFDYIETFYNPQRRHSALGYQSPVDFENQMN